MVRLHDQHADELLVYAHTIVRDEGMALDAVQEVFLRYFLERRLGRDVWNPRPWLYRVLHNYLLDRIERIVNKPEVFSQDVGEVLDEGRSPEDMLSQSELAEEIAGLLTKRELEVLRLRADGLSYGEIGEVLDVRPGTVSALLTRVHGKLRDATGDNASQRLTVAKALYYLFEGGRELFIRESNGSFSTGTAD